MAGLMSPELEEKMGPARAEAPQPVSEAETDPDEVGDDESENVTPEEQKAYEDFVSDGLLLIYEGGEVRQSILDLLDEDPSDLTEILGESAALEDFSPVVALAATAVVVVLELVRRAGENRPDDAVIMHGGKELLEDLAELAEKAGIHDYSQEELNKAWFLGMDLWRESAGAEGLIDTDQLKAEFEEIKAADAKGAFTGGAGAEPAMEGGDELRR